MCFQRMYASTPPKTVSVAFMQSKLQAYQNAMWRHCPLLCEVGTCRQWGQSWAFQTPFLNVSKGLVVWGVLKVIFPTDALRKHWSQQLVSLNPLSISNAKSLLSLFGRSTNWLWDDNQSGRCLKRYCCAVYAVDGVNLAYCIDLDWTDPSQLHTLMACFSFCHWTKANIEPSLFTFFFFVFSGHLDNWWHHATPRRSVMVLQPKPWRMWWATLAIWSVPHARKV